MVLLLEKFVGGVGCKGVLGTVCRSVRPIVQVLCNPGGIILVNLLVPQQRRAQHSATD